MRELKLYNQDGNLVRSTTTTELERLGWRAEDAYPAFGSAMERAQELGTRRGSLYSQHATLALILDEGEGVRLRYTIYTKRGHRYSNSQSIGESPSGQRSHQSAALIIVGLSLLVSWWVRR